MDRRADQSSLTRFDWVVLVLSIYVIVELYCELVLTFPPVVRSATEIIDFLICMVFLGDFGWRLRLAPDKWQFIKWNWIDLLSSIPMVGELRIGRAARVLRLLRLVRSGRIFYALLNRHQAASTFRIVLVLNVVVVALGALAIFHLEAGHDPFFASFGNSLWWSALTATTFGFVQDIVPVSPEGKVVAMLLIGAGMVLVGTFTGMVADYFIGDEEILARMTTVEARLERIEQKLDRLLGEREGPGGAPPNDGRQS